VARTGRDAARRVPVAGPIFGRAPRHELDGRVVFITGDFDALQRAAHTTVARFGGIDVTEQHLCDGESRCIA
jgi:hypothetical protein